MTISDPVINDASSLGDKQHRPCDIAGLRKEPHGIGEHLERKRLGQVAIDQPIHSGLKTALANAAGPRA